MAILCIMAKQKLFGSYNFLLSLSFFLWLKEICIQYWMAFLFAAYRNSAAHTDDREERQMQRRIHRLSTVHDTSIDLCIVFCESMQICTEIHAYAYPNPLFYQINIETIDMHLQAG